MCHSQQIETLNGADTEHTISPFYSAGRTTIGQNNSSWRGTGELHQSSKHSTNRQRRFFLVRSWLTLQLDASVIGCDCQINYDSALTLNNKVLSIPQVLLYKLKHNSNSRM
jgi:hypothetical protein